MDDAKSRETSASLLRRLRESPGDHGAWNEFDGRYRPRILAWCRKWGLQDADAEDVTQTILLRLAVKLRGFSYDPSQSFRGWLRTVAHHVWADFVSERQQRHTLTGTPDGAAALNSIPAREDLTAHLAETFDLELLEEASARVQARVAEKTWEAFRRTALLGETGASVAGALGMPVASVFKARSNVQKWLHEELRQLERLDSA